MHHSEYPSPRDPGLAAFSFVGEEDQEEQEQGRRGGKEEDEKKKEGDEEEDMSNDDMQDIGDNVNYSHGLFNFATHVVSDCGNSLVWCAADNGDRIKAFRAPKAIRPVNRSATCNKAENGLSLQYTLCSQSGRGDHAGLHVIGTQVICIKGES